MAKSKSIAAPPAAPQIGPSKDLKDLSDTHIGPLARAEALADVLEYVAADNSLRDNSTAVLSRMLVDSLDQVRAVIQAEVSRG